MKKNLRRMEMFGYSRRYNNSTKSGPLNNVLAQSTQAYGVEFRHKHNSISSIINHEYPAKLDSLPSPIKTFEITPNSDMLSENRRGVNNFNHLQLIMGRIKLIKDQIKSIFLLYHHLKEQEDNH